MVMRAQIGTVKPNPHFNFHMSHISPLWRVAMYDEYNALVKNNTWILVPTPPNANVVGIDCDDTFSPVVKPATIWTVLSLALSPPGFYGFLFSASCLLVTAFLIWFEADTYYHHETEVAYLFIYVDDIVLTASSMDLLQRIISSLHKEFDMTDLGALNYFLEIFTQIDMESKLSSDGDPISDPTIYRSLAGGLQLPYYHAIYIWLLCFLGDNLLPWSARRQHTLSRSSVEAVFIGVANVVVKIAWLHNLLRELHTPLLSVTIVYCDNVRVLHVPSRYQYADIFTKVLPSALFEEFRTSLSVQPSLA
ncbi:ribonuclease H-like domain-containing protein [Tanacetum coccineum]